MKKTVIFASNKWYKSHGGKFHALMFGREKRRKCLKEVLYEKGC